MLCCEVYDDCLEVDDLYVVDEIESAGESDEMEVNSVMNKSKL